MFWDVTAVTAILILGNILFRHFDPHYTLAYRARKIALIVALTTPISYYFGHRGVLIAYSLAALPLIYIHAIHLPSKGINGWTAEPRHKYRALRGWPPPDH